MPVLTAGAGHGAAVRAQKMAFRRGMLRDEYNYKNRNDLSLSGAQGEREMALQGLRNQGDMGVAGLQHGKGGSIDRSLKSREMEGASDRAMNWINNESQRNFMAGENEKQRAFQGGLTAKDEATLRQKSYENVMGMMDDEGRIGGMKMDGDSLRQLAGRHFDYLKGGGQGKAAQGTLAEMQGQPPAQPKGTAEQEYWRSENLNPRLAAGMTGPGLAGQASRGVARIWPRQLQPGLSAEQTQTARLRS